METPLGYEFKTKQTNARFCCLNALSGWITDSPVIGGGFAAWVFAGWINPRLSYGGYGGSSNERLTIVRKSFWKEFPTFVRLSPGIGADRQNSSFVSFAWGFDMIAAYVDMSLGTPRWTCFGDDYAENGFSGVCRPFALGFWREPFAKGAGISVLLKQSGERPKPQARTGPLSRGSGAFARRLLAGDRE
jgi:hypothetical protein